MLTITNYPEISTYPGEYTPVQSKFETLAEELSKPREGASSPADNISETPEYYKIELAVPGLNREDFFVNINELGTLSVAALHKEPKRIENEKYHRHTFNYECFTHKLLLPENIDTDFNKAEYNAGILSIWFLKTEKPYKRRASMIVVY
ncbi:MAG: Hsp20/alpha crystallin family protein [Ginsengibacter sp.]